MQQYYPAANRAFSIRYRSVLIVRQLPARLMVYRASGAQAWQRLYVNNITALPSSHHGRRARFPGNSFQWI